MVHVTGLTSIEGQVIVSVHDEHTYLHDDAFVGRASAKLTTTDVRVAVDHVPAGRFLVVVVHDTNGDGTLDTNALGLPTEAYGFSRGARGTFGPPSFDDAAFEFDGRSAEVSVQPR